MLWGGLKPQGRAQGHSKAGNDCVHLGSGPVAGRGLNSETLSLIKYWDRDRGLNLEEGGGGGRRSYGS